VEPGPIVRDNRVEVRLSAGFETDKMTVALITRREQFVRARFLCVLVMLVPMAATAQAYKCKRPDGKTSFQDQPCDEGSTGGPVIISDPSPSSGIPAPPKGMARSMKRDKIPDPRKGQADESLKERNRQLEAQNRATACSMARRNLSVLQAQRPVYSTDKNGNKQYVEDGNRQSEIAAAQQRVAEDCS
jgi:hypothetical protein